MYVRERAEEGTRLVLEVARETGIHDTPISRSAVALSGVHTAAADAPGPRLHIGARNYGGSLARSLARFLASSPSPLPCLRLRFVFPLRSG